MNSGFNDISYKTVKKNKKLSAFFEIDKKKEEK